MKLKVILMGDVSGNVGQITEGYEEEIIMESGQKLEKGIGQ